MINLKKHTIYKSAFFLGCLTSLLACNTSNAETSTQSKNVTITAVGDIMIGSDFPNDNFLPNDDAVNSFAKVKPYLKGDIVFGNLEGVLANGGSSSKCGSSNKCFAFRMPERYASIIKQAGFNVLSTANNHSGDFGNDGREKTRKALDRIGIHHAGHIEKHKAVFTINGIKYGFVAFAPNTNMLSINDITAAQNIVSTLKASADIVIVSFHGGAEGAQYTRVPKQKEMFLGENRGDVYKFAHSVIDSGADIVLGHEPHVTRAVELYKNKFIAYSLGNFNTYGQFNLKGVNGVSPILTINLTPQGNFINAKVISTKQTKENGLQLDSQNQAFSELKRLTQADFPNTQLLFRNNTISIKK